MNIQKTIFQKYVQTANMLRKFPVWNIFFVTKMVWLSPPIIAKNTNLIYSNITPINNKKFPSRSFKKNEREFFQPKCEYYTVLFS